MTREVPHIETGALEAALRNCAKFLTTWRDVVSDPVLRADLTAAIDNAVAQADSLATIRRQSHLTLLGRVPFETAMGTFPTQGVEVPFLTIREGEGDISGIGFFNRDACGKIGTALVLMALTAPFPDEPPPDGKAH